MQVKVEKDVSQIGTAQLFNEVPVCHFTGLKLIQK